MSDGYVFFVGILDRFLQKRCVYFSIGLHRHKVLPEFLPRFLKGNIEHPTVFRRDIKPIAVSNKRSDTIRYFWRNLFPFTTTVQ
ncbi:MAG: hypothetical protein OXN25_24025 [Candidatus Poribacteria bacterium]|nr:hypothetical protein [Candidatus Poribacteria bacterium]